MDWFMDREAEGYMGIDGHHVWSSIVVCRFTPEGSIFTRCSHVRVTTWCDRFVTKSRCRAAARSHFFTPRAIVASADWVHDGKRRGPCDRGENSPVQTEGQQPGRPLRLLSPLSLCWHHKRVWKKNSVPSESPLIVLVCSLPADHTWSSWILPRLYHLLHHELGRSSSCTDFLRVAYCCFSVWSLHVFHVHPPRTLMQKAWLFSKHDLSRTNFTYSPSQCGDAFSLNLMSREITNHDLQSMNFSHFHRWCLSITNISRLTPKVTEHIMKFSSK